MTGKPCCSESRRERMLGKLGGCARCMRESLALAAGLWAFVVALAAVGAPTAVRTAALVGAAAMTTLFAAHVIAFFGRTARLHRAGVTFARVGPDGEDVGRSRRGFLAAGAAMLAGVLFTPLLRIAQSSPVVQKSGPHTPCNEIRTVVRITKDKPITVRTCTRPGNCIGREKALLRLCGSHPYWECHKAKDCDEKKKGPKQICDSVIRGTTNITTSCTEGRDRKVCGKGTKGEDLVECVCVISVSSGATQGEVVCGCSCQTL